MRARSILLPLALCLAFAAPVLAEVMDKEPTVADVWQQAVVFGLIGFALCRLWAWSAVATLSYSYGLVEAVQDPFVGPAIRAEAGMGYVLQVYLAFGFVVLCQGVGIALFVRQRKIALNTRARLLLFANAVAYVLLAAGPFGALCWGWRPVSVWENLSVWALHRPLAAVSALAILVCVGCDIACGIQALRHRLREHRRLPA